MGAMEILSGKLKEKVSINYFDFKYIIGRGGFGKVWKVVCKKNSKEYAMKVMSKVKIIDRKSQKSIISERNLLSKLHHPFLVNMIYSFQDKDQLYLVMDLLTGGDLRYHISRYRYFTQEQAKFFLACLLLGLEYIHENAVIHRDIKPENLVCDERGYIRITDFGVAKKYHRENSSETSGTPGYMAPEVLCAQNHSYAVDYFALGVIGFEFMMGKRPYHGRSRKEVKQDVLAKQIQIKQKDIPCEWSIEAADFINNLIQRKPNQRLGANGINEIKNHPWFAGFSWELVAKKIMDSPFVPKQGDNYDRHYCEGEDKIGEETLNRYNAYKQSENYEIFFKKYTCNNISQEEFLNSTISHNNTLGSSNTTISSTKIPSSRGSLTNIGSSQVFGDLSKSKIKPNIILPIQVKPLQNESSLNTNKSNSNYFSLSKEDVNVIKASFLSPKSVFYNSSNFSSSNIHQQNLPFIQTGKKQLKKSPSSQSMFPMKSPTSRFQGKISRDTSMQFIMNKQQNPRQFSFSNKFMSSTIGMNQVNQMKRNKSTMVVTNGFTVNKSMKIKQ